MPASTVIRGPKAADPGVAFQLELGTDLFTSNGEFSGAITVKLYVKGDGEGDFPLHWSSLVINGPIKETSHCVVLPYGCDHYPPGSTIKVKFYITVEPTGQSKSEGYITMPNQDSDGWSSVPTAAQDMIFCVDHLEAVLANQCASAAS